MVAVPGAIVGEGVIAEPAATLPQVALPRALPATLLWRRVFVLAWVLLILFFLDRITLLLSNLWVYEAVGYESVYWTNFRMGTGLFAVTAVAFTALIAAPAFTHRVSAQTRRIAVATALFIGLVAGYLMSQNYHTFLLLFNGQSFGVDDPIFGRDISFYTFELPGLWKILRYALWGSGLAIIASVVLAYMSRRTFDPEQDRNPSGLGWFSRLFGVIGTPYTLAMLALFGILGAIEFWFRRYGLLVRNNEEAGVFNGAQALDVTGFFSTRNDFLLTALVELGIIAAIIYALRTLHRAVRSDTPIAWRRPVRQAGTIIVALLIVDFAFKAGVTLRDEFRIKPNEPVAQIPFLQDHVDATLAAYGLDDIETLAFTPNEQGDPLPSADDLLATSTLQNAPLWPGFVSSLEQVLDPQHADRVAMLGAEGKEFVVYGPTLDTFQQEQSLRPYYNFLDIDTVRYTIDGQPTIFASAVRELPIDPYRPQPWLLHWSQQHALYTHGHGLVMVPVAGVDPDGGPNYAISGIPSEVSSPELELSNESVYYGEGMEAPGYTNMQGVPELDYPTDTGQVSVEPGTEDGTGLKVDSLLRRLVIGYRTESLSRVFFTDMITEETRVHYIRMPIQRASLVAPFIFMDADAYAVEANGDIVWMVHGMTTTDRYPYSRIGQLGDKSDVRSPIVLPDRTVNYIEDSVKVTINADTGEVTYYQIANGPVIDTWAEIYPDLLTPAADMPEQVREQIQYSPQLFHIQFDDIYWQYHMKEAIPFFQAEDIWDDGDEVLGPVLVEGEGLSFSIEPYYWLADTGGQLPESSNGTQFTLAKIFTPEAALNLRAMPMVYMEGEDYGKLFVLEVPKGHFLPGPEQADAAIDQEPRISEQISWWNRLGNEVIRGHTSAVVVGDELIYVEPIFIRSKQNPLPQLKRIIVVFRGHAAMGATIEEALQVAIDNASTTQAVAAAP